MENILKKHIIIEKAQQYVIIIKGKLRSFINKQEEGSLIKTKKLHVILEGEEIYIKKIILPKTRKKYIENLIKNELSLYFKNIEDMIFDYLIFMEIGTTLEIMVFYINTENCSFFQDYKLNLKNLKSIDLIQFVMLKHFKNQIHKENYIFICLHNDSLYFILCNKNIVIANSVYKNYKSYNSLEKLYNNFEGKYLSISSEKIEEIYFANFSDKKDISKFFMEEHTYIDLGIFNSKDLFSKYK